MLQLMIGHHGLGAPIWRTPKYQNIVYSTETIYIRDSNAKDRPPSTIAYHNTTSDEVL